MRGIKAVVVETSSNTVIDISIDMSKLTSGSILPITGPDGTGGIQGITMKGTSTSDVTTWIDPGGHRVIKSHATAKTTSTTSFVLSPGSTMPMMGPMTTQGDEIVDLTPA